MRDSYMCLQIHICATRRDAKRKSNGSKGPNDPRFHPWAQRAQRSQRGPEQGSIGPKGPRVHPWAQRAQRPQRGPEQGSKGPKVPTGNGPWVQRADRAPRALAKGPGHRDQRKETGKGPNGDRGALRSPKPRVHESKGANGDQSKGSANGDQRPEQGSMGPKVPTGTRARVHGCKGPQGPQRQRSQRGPGSKGPSGGQSQGPWAQRAQKVTAGTRARVQGSKGPK